MHPGPEIFLIASLAICFGAVLQASTGLGAGMITFPIIALLSLKLVPGPLVFSTLFLSIYMAYVGRADIRFTRMYTLAVGIIIGTLIGGYSLTLIPVQHLGVFFGLLLLLVVIISIAGVKLAINKRNMFSMGTAAGFMGITVAGGSPFMALMYQHEKGPTIRATLSLIYMFGCIFTITVLSATGKFGAEELLYGLYLTPGYIAGYVLSLKVRPYLDAGYSRIVILLISSLSAITLIMKSIS